MIKAKKIWIATHPEESTNQVIQTTEPNETHEYIESQYHGGESAYVEWQEYVAIPVE